MKNYFRGSKASPYHLSVGAAVVNKKGEVACHYFKEFRGLQNFYILMRETVEPNESIETALQRGLGEEFNLTASLDSYLGSIVSYFERDGVSVEKTTLYFRMNLISINSGERSGEDPESSSEIQWLEPAVLEQKIREQATRIGMSDLDEGEIVRRLQSSIKGVL